MTADWQGAQWVLATFLLGSVVLPPVIRYGLILNDYTPKTDWRTYLGSRVGDFLVKAALVAILFWGGFW
jgi:hypothetical protein